MKEGRLGYRKEGRLQEGTGGRCGQCEFIRMNTLLSEVRLWAV